MRIPAALLSLFLLCFGSVPAYSGPVTPEEACRLIEMAGASNSGRATQRTGEGSASVTLRPPGQNWRIAMIDITDKEARPLMQIRALPPCNPMEARRLRRDGNGKIAAIEVLAPDLVSVIAVEPQDPPLPAMADSPHRSGSALLAHVDTGINYLLPELWPHLAADGDSRLLGYDFWDMDARPFDVDPRRTPFFPQHHGTTVFGVLAREVPDAGIAVYRFPATEMCRFADLVSDMAALGVRVANMSMGSGDKGDWRCFQDAAARNPQILFVVSAGNDGKDIDRQPVYPAALTLSNMLVVTSSDSFGRLGRGSNVGASSVDVMVPGERVEVIDHRGARAETGGTSYAAPRVAALASRFLMANPDAGTEDIIDFIRSRAIDAPGVPLAHGWIPDPTDDYGF